MISKRKISFLLICILFFQLVSGQYHRADWKERDTWMHVEELFNYAKLQKGNFVADIGCHEGYLTFHLSERVGDKGTVFAVDVREDRLDKLNQNLKEAKVTNVKTVLGDYDNPKLPDKTMDIIFVVDTYHEIENYTQILSHIKTALKPNGKLLILEKLKEQHIGKSRDAQANGHTLSISFVEKELKDAGFKIEKRILISALGTMNPKNKCGSSLLVSIQITNPYFPIRIEGLHTRK